MNIYSFQLFFDALFICKMSVYGFFYDRRSLSYIVVEILCQQTVKRSRTSENCSSFSQKITVAVLTCWNKKTKQFEKLDIKNAKKSFSNNCCPPIQRIIILQSKNLFMLNSKTSCTWFKHWQLSLIYVCCYWYVTFFNDKFH